MSMNYVRVIATFSCRRAAPQALVGQRAYLFDADPLRDDFLSSSTVQPDGTAGFLFDLSSSRSLDSLFETKPDLYCLVKAADDTVLYRSEIRRNIDFLHVDPVSHEQQRTIQIDFAEAAG